MDKNIQQSDQIIIKTFETIQMPLHDFNIINNKNTELSNKVILLEGNADQLRETIRNNEDEIRLLTTANNEYIKRIDLLEKENKELREKIQILENTVIEQKNDIQNLKNDIEQHKNDITYLKNENLKLKDKEHIKLLGFLMQDLNDEYDLQKTMGQKFVRRLNNMRNIRNDDAHYILNKDSNNLKILKTELICNHINKLNPEIIKKTERKYRCNNAILDISQVVTNKIKGNILDRTILDEYDLEDLEELEELLNEY